MGGSRFVAGGSSDWQDRQRALPVYPGLLAASIVARHSQQQLVPEHPHPCGPLHVCDTHTDRQSLHESLVFACTHGRIIILGEHESTKSGLAGLRGCWCWAWSLCCRWSWGWTPRRCHRRHSPSIVLASARRQCAKTRACNVATCCSNLLSSIIMRRPWVAVGLLLAASCAVSATTAAPTSMPPLSPMTGPLAFPYLSGTAAKAYRMNLPEDFLALIIADAKNLRHSAGGGNYVDNKGTTWWQPKSEPRRFSIEQMIEIIGKMDFPEGMPRNILGAEYWIQERRGDEDGGFHYDKDESAASNKQRMIFPSLSTITYLTDGGAPTMVLNQTTNQFGNTEVPAVPTEGWLSFPETGKHLWFRGTAQHGVPGSLCQHKCDEMRLVLLINWWDHAPEPPNCQRLMNRKVKELGLQRISKDRLKQIKAELVPEEIETQHSESVRTSAAVQSIEVMVRSPGRSASTHRPCVYAFV